MPKQLFCIYSYLKPVLTLFYHNKVSKICSLQPIHHSSKHFELFKMAKAWPGYKIQP